MASLLLLAAAALPADAQELSDKLSVHGYLTQGYAKTDSLVLMGMTRAGTSDYRRAALLFRYDGTEKDRFILQLAHRRLGNSPAMQFESDIKVDWAYYERQLFTGTRLRVGKAPLPMGIYNETRYVGVTQPFYRAPYSVYLEGAFTSETVDGITLAHSIGEGMGLDVQLYGGSYSLIESAPVQIGVQPDGTPVRTYFVGRVPVRDVAGGQVWLRTPIPGVRVGGGRSRASGGGQIIRGTMVVDMFSADATFERAFVRAERRVADFRTAQWRYEAQYAQAGARIAGPLSLNAQIEQGDVFSQTTGTAMQMRDAGLGASWTFNPGLVAKLEGHRTNGRSAEHLLATPTARSNYLISSLSVAF